MITLSTAVSKVYNSQNLSQNRKNNEKTMKALTFITLR